MPVAIATDDQREARKMRAEVKGQCLACGRMLGGPDWVYVGAPDSDDAQVTVPLVPFREFLWDTHWDKAGHCVRCIAFPWTNEEDRDAMAAYQVSRREQP